LRIPKPTPPNASGGPECKTWDRPLGIDQIYDLYAPDVLRWAYRLAGPQFDAEDLLHDVFVVALRRYHEFRGEAKITSWLFLITERVVRWRRKRHAVRRLLWRQNQHGLADSQTKVPTPVEEVERIEDARRLYAALDKLPEKYRTTLVLSALEGLTGAEIAELTGTDANTVWVRLHRARAKLAATLAEEAELAERKR
jgi:RNA polymerase sigma-70 factor, ECF subfamily